MTRIRRIGPASRRHARPTVGVLKRTHVPDRRAALAPTVKTRRGSATTSGLAFLIMGGALVTIGELCTSVAPRS